MYLIAILILLAVSTCAQFINENGCGRRPFKNKIVGGHRAIEGDWGWQVSMNYNGRHICGGTIINRNWVLGAAHCLLYGLDPNGYTFSIGIHDRYKPEKGSQEKKITRIIAHPSYDGITLWNDIALFKLDSPVDINNGTIIPACLQETNSNLADVEGWATGWGNDNTGGASVRHKLEVNKKILNDSDCKLAFGSFIDPTIQICAGHYGLGRDTCVGDAGGPLVIQNKFNKRWYQVGIISFGTANCGDGGVYVRVSAYINWIRKILLLN